MSLLDNFLGGNTLYYPGCLIKAVLPEINDNYRDLLRQAGIDFIELSKVELCCGSPVANTGFTKDAKEAAKKNLELFKTHGVAKLVSPCPACAYTFGREYPEWLGDDWDIKVEHVTKTLSDAVEKGDLKIEKNVKTATFHDPCYLARYQDITEEPRKLLALAAEETKEMELSKKETFCCGGGGGSRATNLEQSKEIGRTRAEMAKDAGAKTLVTACPMCYVQLKDNAPKDIKVLELSEILVTKTEKEA